MIPEFQTLMLPVLRAVAEEKRHTRDVIQELATKFDLSEEDRAQRYQKSGALVLGDRMTWAKTYMKKAGLLQYTQRGFYVATDEGRKVLAQNLERIDCKFLMQYESFKEFKRLKKKQPTAEENTSETIEEIDLTPEETLVAVHQEINEALASDLLDRVCAASPQFLEHLIIELLLKMGYGGTFEDAARALGQSGDNGVDGVVDQDLLGVDQIYIQAKRYSTSTVGASDIRNFSGALDFNNAQKGIFFTTSTFSKAARETADKLSARIVLIDGQLLAELMIRHNVGCRDEQPLYLKKIDEGFFEQ